MLRSLSSTILKSARTASPLHTSFLWVSLLVAGYVVFARSYTPAISSTTSSVMSTVESLSFAVSLADFGNRRRSLRPLSSRSLLPLPIHLAIPLRIAQEAIKSRRSHYALSASSPIPDSRIVHLVNEAVKHSPSSFNSQSSRALVLIGEHHEKLWTFVKEAIRGVVPDEEAWKKSEQRLNGFQGAYGTVLLFEDQQVVAGLQEKLPLYKDKVRCSLDASSENLG